MRLLAISDLHLERRRLSDLPPLADFDVLVCAGDLWEGEPEAGLCALASLAGDRPVVVVPGNHEFYRRDADDPRTCADLLAALDAEASRLNRDRGAASIHVLAGGRAVDVGGVRFVGATLWSDWSLAGRWLRDAAPGSDLPCAPNEAMAVAMASMSHSTTGLREFDGTIRAASGAPWSPRDAMAAHVRERELLSEALVRSRGRPVVVVTHYPPVATIMDPYRDEPGVPWWLPAFYGSTVLDDLAPGLQPDLWISGHFHAGHDFVRGRTRCLANPVEGGTFDPGWVVAIAPAESPPDRGSW